MSSLGNLRLINCAWCDVDSNDTVNDSDNTIINESDPGDSPHHATIYPNLSSISATLQ